MELIYILLPTLFLLHKIEEVLTIWHYKKLPIGRTCILIGIEFILVHEAAVDFIYGTMSPMFVLYYAFGFHVLRKIVLSAINKIYVPGTVTAVLLLPYSLFGIWNLLERYPIDSNFWFALGGIIVAIADYAIVRYFVRPRK